MTRKWLLALALIGGVSIADHKVKTTRQADRKKRMTMVSETGFWKSWVAAAILFGAAIGIAGTTPAAAADKPNILVIMADDVGYWNISAYNRGMMGYRTPNIDRIAKEGAIFTDYYGQQSCTAGRAAFITGQAPLRTGLTKVGLPGAKEGLSAKDPTLAELLKPFGYATRFKKQLARSVAEWLQRLGKRRVLGRRPLAPGSPTFRTQCAALPGRGGAARPAVQLCCRNNR